MVDSRDYPKYFAKWCTRSAIVVTINYRIDKIKPYPIDEGNYDNHNNPTCIPSSSFCMMNTSRRLGHFNLNGTNNSYIDKFFEDIGKYKHN